MRLSSDPYQGNLPGRRDWFGLCHEWGALCPECLRRIAEVLAEEMDWRLGEALDRTTESYRAEVGVGATRGEHSLINIEQARELRRYTVAACLRVEHERIGIPLASIDSVILADEVVSGEGRRELLRAEAQAA